MGGVDRSIAQIRNFMASPKFYLDSHIPKEVAIQLRAKNVDAIHCAEIGMEDASDEEHLTYAAENGRIMVTCDPGIEYELHYKWIAAGKRHMGIAFFRGEDQCKSISVVFNELMFLWEAANDASDLYNQFWRKQR